MSSLRLVCGRVWGPGSLLIGNWCERAVASTAPGQGSWIVGASELKKPWEQVSRQHRSVSFSSCLKSGPDLCTVCVQDGL